MMKVGLSPSVSFKSGYQANSTNLLENAKPVSKPLEEDKFVYNQEKIDNFNSRLNDSNWEKRYYPNGNYLFMKQKDMIDGLEYMISADGTVKEVGSWVKSSVIMNANNDMAALVESYANKSQQNTQQKELNDTNVEKKSIKEKFKTGIANIWKFFTVAETMSVASAKGTFYGAIAGGVTLLCAMVVRAPKILKQDNATLKTLISNPLKSAGKAGTAIAVATGLATLAGFMVAGKMKANQKSSVIEHKMDVQHVYD